MTAARLRRSCLTVPASSEKMLSKARGLVADEVVLDIEDAGAPSEKTDRTRQNVVDALTTAEWVAKTLAVRVNGARTRWCFRDMAYIAEHAGVKAGRERPFRSVWKCSLLCRLRLDPLWGSPVARGAMACSTERSERPTARSLVWGRAG